MNFLRWWVLATTTVGASIVQNKNIPACRDCVHYNRNIWNSDFTYRYNECKYFGTKDIVTGKIGYKSADKCREKEELCGYEGKYFEKNDYVYLKMIQHGLIHQGPTNAAWVLFFLYILGRALNN